MIQGLKKYSQLHPDSYRDGKDIRVGQGVKKSCLRKILALGRLEGQTNFTQHPTELQSD